MKTIGHLFIIQFAYFSILTAQTPANDRATPLALPRLTGPITLDGFSDEPAWEAVAPLPMVMFMPTYQGTPTERTEVRMAYDDDYLYLAGRLYDSDPDGIMAASFKRDEFGMNNDWLGLVLDTFNDNETGLGFFTTPTGLRADAAVFNDAEGDWPVNTSWNTFWDVATVQNGEGWFAELRIPFSSLRFQDNNGEVIMGLSCWRYIPRKNEMAVFPDVPTTWGMWGLWKPSQMRKVLLNGIKPSKPVYITPYCLGGVTQVPSLNEAGSAYTFKNTLAGDVGLDLKYSLTSNLTADLTVNTDFAQVEADDQQVNLTRFSLYFPEKRLFFQERASIFDFNWGQYDRLFYSRRIGLHEGQVVPIYGGVRLVGRLGGWDLGLMDMQTASLEDEYGEQVLSSENMGVLRLRRQVINPYSYAGAMVTSRLGTDGSYNRVYGVDGVFRLFGDDYLSAKWAQTFNNGMASPASMLDNAMLRLNWERRTKEGLGYNIDLIRTGSAFNPGLGFKTRDNYTQISGFLSYGWLPGEGSRIYRHRIRPIIIPYFNNATGKLESNDWGLIWDMETKAGGGLMFWPRSTYDALADTFFVSGSEQAYVPTGNYRFYETVVAFYTPPGQHLASMFDLTLGQYYDGWRWSSSVTPTWVVSRYLNFGGYVQYNRVEFPARSQRLDAFITRLRLQVTLNTALSLLAFVQLNSASDAVIANVRFRYNPKEGTDFYLVYNHNLDLEAREGLPPLPPLTTNRTLLLKFSITFLR